MRAWVLVAALGLSACMGEPEPPASQAAQDFTDNCAACHGASGQGDGPAAAGLTRKPADLTLLSAGNDGDFPGTRVMAKIWGYTGAPSGSPMPAFGPLLDSPLVPFDGGDGIASPTPIRLVELAEYVRRLQR